MPAATRDRTVANNASRVNAWSAVARCLLVFACCLQACSNPSFGGFFGSSGGTAPTPGMNVPATGGSLGGLPSAAPVATCTGKRGALRGKSNQTLTVSGLTRTFVYYAPQNLAPNTAAPLVILVHGWLMNGQAMYDITGYKEVADREGLVLAFPDGYDTAWNVGLPTCGSTILGILPLPNNDDQGLIDAIIQFADNDQCIDHDHVFMTGFSMGAYFTNASGCLRDDLAAVAPHSGGSLDFTSCRPGPKPALVMHFNGDALIPTQCGAQARDRWVQHNGCQSASPEVVSVRGGQCEYYRGCPTDGQVAYCTFNIPSSETNAAVPGHAWSGGLKVGASAQYAIPSTESATELSWSFFKEYAW